MVRGGVENTIDQYFHVGSGRIVGGVSIPRCIEIRSENILLIVMKGGGSGISGNVVPITPTGY